MLETQEAEAIVTLAVMAALADGRTDAATEAAKLSPTRVLDLVRGKGTV